MGSFTDAIKMSVKLVFISLGFIGFISTSLAQIEWLNDMPSPVMTTCARGTDCVNATTMSNTYCRQNDRICMFAEMKGKPVCTHNEKCYLIHIVPNLLPEALPNTNLTTYEIPCLCPVGTFCDYSFTLRNRTSWNDVFGRCVPRPGVVVQSYQEILENIYHNPQMNKVMSLPGNACVQGTINPYRMKTCRPHHELSCSSGNVCMRITEYILDNNVDGFLCDCNCPEGSECLYESKIGFYSYDCLIYSCTPKSKEIVGTITNRTSTAETVTNNSNPVEASVPQIKQNEAKQPVTITCAPGHLCTADTRKINVSLCQNEPVKNGRLYSTCMDVYYNVTHILRILCRDKCPHASTCLFHEDQMDGLDFFSTYVCRPDRRDEPQDYCLRPKVNRFLRKTPDNKEVWEYEQTFPPQYTTQLPLVTQENQCSEDDEDVLCRLKQHNALPTCTPSTPCMKDGLYRRIYSCLCPRGTRCDLSSKKVIYFCRATAIGVITESPVYTQKNQTHQCAHDEQCMKFYQGTTEIRSYKSRCNCPLGLTCRPRYFHRHGPFPIPTAHYCSSSVRNLTADIVPYEPSTSKQTEQFTLETTELLTNVNLSWTTQFPERTTKISKEGTGLPLCPPNETCLFEVYNDSRIIKDRYYYNCQNCTEGYSCHCIKDVLSQKYYEYSCRPVNEKHLEKNRCYGF